MLKKILFASALLMGCDSPEWTVEMTDAEVASAPDAGMPDAESPDAETPDVYEATCGALGEECCAPDAAPAWCAEGLACAYHEGAYQCDPITCTGDTPGLCPSGQSCVYNVTEEHYLCANCGELGQPCCQGYCNNNGNHPGQCTGGLCI